jgi:hypothetical protein
MAANPAGKKHGASMGWTKTRRINQRPEVKPMSRVARPVRSKTRSRVLLGPKRSVAHPAMRVVKRPEIRESPMRVLARGRSIPCAAVRYRGSMVKIPKEAPMPRPNRIAMIQKED